MNASPKTNQHDIKPTKSPLSLGRGKSVFVAEKKSNLEIIETEEQTESSPRHTALSISSADKSMEQDKELQRSNAAVVQFFNQVEESKDESPAIKSSKKKKNYY